MMLDMLKIARRMNVVFIRVRLVVCIFCHVLFVRSEMFKDSVCTSCNKMVGSTEQYLCFREILCVIEEE